MARPRKWNGPTIAIRVPEALAEQLLEVARQLEAGFVQNPTAPAVLMFNGPYLVTINERAYLIDPPPVLMGEEAETVQQLAAKITAELSPKDLALLVANLAEKWCEPIGGADA